MALLFPPFQLAVDRLTDESGHAAVADQFPNPFPHLFREAHERWFVA